MLRKLRKSSRVTLVLIGVAAGLAGCKGDDQRRDIYASREDCLADWGNKPEDCSPASDASHRRLGHYYGPSYTYHSGGSGSTWTRGTHGRALGSTSSSHGSSHTSRGGFGSTGHSSGG